MRTEQKAACRPYRKVLHLSLIHISKAEEPFVDAHIYTPTAYVGSMMELCQNRRGIMRDMKYICLLYTSRCV